MKTLSIYLNESNMQISDNELLKDYDSVNAISGNEKKVLAEKYSCKAKIKDIQDAILNQLRINRSAKTTFNEQDIKNFHRLEIPERYSNCIPFFDKESMQFLKYYKEYKFKNLSDKHLDKKIDLVNSRDWNYHMTYSDKYEIMRYVNVDKYIKEHDSEYINDVSTKEYAINDIANKLFGQTKEFKETFIDKAKEYAEETYDKAPKYIEKFKSLYEKYKEKANARLEELKKENKFSAYKDYEYMQLQSSYNEAYSSYSKYNSIIKNYTKSSYIAEAAKNAESTFNYNINALAKRIHDKNEFDVQNLTVKHIDEQDPKYFKLQITDSKTTLYARSVLAAEYSEKMIPHFRFIITSKK